MHLRNVNGERRNGQHAFVASRTTKMFLALVHEKFVFRVKRSIAVVAEDSITSTWG